MSLRKDLKIFIASSGQLQAERDEAIKAITEVNKNFKHLFLEPVLFELDTASGNNPGMERIQDSINPLLDESQIVVVLFYSRVGEFTREEFNRAKDAEKKIFLYLKSGFQATSVDSSNKFTEVLKLKEDIEKESAIRYQSFEAPKEFNNIFYKDLNKYLSDKYPVLEDIQSSPLELFVDISENKLSSFPRSKSYFNGRDKEIKVFKEAIEANETFIAIDGPGGIGKTQFVSHCIEKFIPKEKVIWFDCTSASQFDTLISEAGYPELLKGSSKTDREKFSAFTNKIQENSYYLFFDNFQETNNSPVFKEFLSFIQQYLQKGSVIVIDRDDIRSVSLTPKPIHIEGIKEGGLEYAKALITYSYKDEINNSDADLEQLCSQLQGYPLAIDFAIYLLSKGVSISEIISKIVQDGDAEQISERLLNAIFSRPDAIEEEKEFIRQFSVFTSAVSNEAVKFVIPGNLIQLAVRKLQEKNLLSYAGGYYEIHPLVREFCYRRLVEKDAVHAKAAEFYISQRTFDLSPGLEEQIFYHLSKSGQWDRIEKEIEEKGRQFIILGQFGLLKELLEKLKGIGLEKPIFNIFLGDIAEIQGKWDEAQVHFAQARLNSEDKRIKAEGIIKYGEMLYRKGNVNDALPYFEEALEFSTKHYFSKETARALNDIGLAFEFFGDLNVAYEKLDAALKIRRDIDDKDGIAATFNNLGDIYESWGELDKALTLHNDSLKLRREMSDKVGIANSLNKIGNIYVAKGKVDDALFNFNESLKIARTIGDQVGISVSLRLAGDVIKSRGNREKALTNYKESYEIGKLLGDKQTIAESLRCISRIFYIEGRFDDALKVSEESLEISREIEDKDGISSTLNLVSNILSEHHRYEEAMDKLNEALSIREEMGKKMGLAAIFHNIGSLYKDQKLYELSLLNFFKAYALDTSIGINLDSNTTTKAIIGLRDSVLGLNAFKIIAIDAFQKLSDELKRFIPLNEFIKEPIHRDTIKVGRNDPCPCGSGKKYKNCHGAN